MKMQSIKVFFLLFILLNSSYAFAFSAVVNERLSFQEKNASNENERIISARCSLQSLNSLEKQALLKLLQSGFVGKSIDGNAVQPQVRDSLDRNTLIIPVNDKDAIKTEVPSEVIEPLETMHLSGRVYNGAFSFGVVIDDTLRVGRCNYDQLKSDANRQCPLDGSLLKLRNDSTSFSTIKKPFFDLVKEIIGKEDTEELSSEDVTKIRDAFNVPEKLEDLEVPETNEKIKQESVESKLALEDKETMNVSQVVRRTDMPFIANTIRSDNFRGFFQTNCASTSCTISVYSLFDKYYNTWFSSEMLLSMGFPALQAGARKLFNYLNIGPESYAVKGLFPFNLNRSEFADRLRAKFASAGTLLGGLRARRIEKLRRTYPDLAKILDPLLEPRGGWDAGYLLTKGTSFRGWFANEFMKSGGLLDQVAADPKMKKALYRLFKDLHYFSRAQGNIFVQAERHYNDVLRRFGYGSAEEIAARIEFGKAAIRSMRGYDEIRLDIPEWLMQKDLAANLYKYAVRIKGTNDFRWLYNDPKDWVNIEKKFLQDGSFLNWIGKEAFETKGNAIVLYKAVPGTKDPLSTIKASDAARYKAFWVDRGVKTERGDIMPLQPGTTGEIQHELTAGHPMYELEYMPAELLRPEDLASKLTTGRAKMTVHWEPVRNTQAILDALNNRGFVARRYANILDKALSEQDHLLKDYFSVKGGLKWTAYGYGYDWLKRGFGAEQFSAYQLPDEYKRVSWLHGQDKLYADAFIDFFSNAGSDDGDLFQRLLNNILPYDLGLNYVSEQFTPTSEPYKKLTGRERRTKVENIALMSSTKDSCDACSISIDARNNMQTFSVFFNSPVELKSYMLEETISKKARQLGQTLISFSFHMDLKGETVGSEGSGNINLLEGQKNKETCADKVNSLGLGTLTEAPIIGKYIKSDPSRVGALLAFGESAAYILFGWSGIAASMLQQTLYAPKLNECIDVHGGYYTHIYAPTEKEQESQGTAAKLSTEKVFNAVKEGVNRIFQSVKSTDKETIVSGAFKKQAEEIEKFVQSNKETLVQASVYNEGHISGGIEAIKLFSFWYKGESNPSAYKTEGKEQIQGVDGNTSIVYDYKTGKAFLRVIGPDGSIQLIEINSAPDITRLNAVNTNIPADEIPASITKFQLPDYNALMFEVDIQNNLYILKSEVQLYECIKAAIKEQSGLDLTSNNLSDVFGSVVMVTTDSHPSIKVWPDKKQIIATGTPNHVVVGDLSKIFIYTNRNTFITDGIKDVALGLLNSIQLENGVILVKPETNELIIWLKRNRNAVLTQDDVQGMKIKRHDVVNPETLCEEPAFDIEAIPVLGSELKEEKVKNFNKSLQKLGPFQIFETPTKRYIFYSKLMPDGTCQDFFKIIDKETGKTLLDVPIKSMNVTPTGIEIVDDKGNTHKLDFSAENGIPKVSYNGQPPEPLIMAQGPNGSFWFDPEKGTWYAENAHLLPLLEAFREGALTKVGPQGNVTTTASGNNLSVKIGGESQGFNLPSLPENVFLLVLFILSVFTVITIIRIKK